MIKLHELNNAGYEEAAAMILPLIERAPDLANQVAKKRPFDSTDQLSAAIKSELLKLNEADQLRLFRAHPELAPENPLSMTAASQAEQGRLKLTSQSNLNREKLIELNSRYQEKFGFPFIVALVRHSNIESVMKEFESRLLCDRSSEILAAIEQISAVSDDRIQTSFGTNRIDGMQDRSVKSGEEGESCA